MAMTAKGKHRKAKAHDVELAIEVAAAVPMSAIIALALGCYIGLSGSGVFAVSLLFTALLANLRRDGARPLRRVPQEHRGCAA